MGACSGRAAALDAGSGEDERGVRRLFPERVFGEAVLLADVVAVVGPEHDDRVVGVGASVERVEHLADVVIREGNARQIGLNDVPP